MSNQPETEQGESAEDGRSYIRVRRRSDGRRRDLTLALDALRASAPPKALRPLKPGGIDEEIRRYLDRQNAPAGADAAAREFDDVPTVRLARPTGLEAAAPRRTPTLEMFREEMGRLAETDEPAELVCGPAAAAPIDPAAPTLDFALPPRRPAYPDPRLCSCQEMVDATRGRAVIDVLVGGPIVFRTTLNVEDSAALCEDPYGLAALLTAIRHCPFDGTLMDAHVPARDKDVVGRDGSPYCCAWAREAHEASRLTLVTEKRRDMTAWSRFSGSPAAIWHCPNCGDKLMAANHRRAVFYGHR